MSDPTAQRTLVKSPPELWAEVSEVGSLARHLGEFGEIRITRVEPETTVAWEGELASGTVELEPSGWGTKVTLTAELRAALPEPAPEPEPAPVAVQAAEPEWFAEQPEPAAAEAEVEAEADPGPGAAEVPAPLTADAMLARSGFFARMFKRRRVHAEIGGPSAPAPVPAPPAPVPVPDPAPDPAPPPPMPDPTPLTPPAPEPDPAPPAAAEAEPSVDVVRVLTGALDSLGSAHHRPFSR